MSGATGHFLLIKCYEVSEAGVVQPFAYLHMVFGSVIGLAVFGEMLSLNVITGGAIIVLAGLFVWWREHGTAAMVSRAADPRPDRSA